MLLPLIALLPALLATPYVTPPIGEYVAPAADGSGDWSEAFRHAADLVSQMSLEEKLNATQQNNYYPRVGEVDRLGYSGLFYADGSEGIRGHPYASAFTMALNVASTFDRSLMFRSAVAIGKEARGKGINTQFGPGVNIMRVPEAGREFEYNGADPYLAGQAAAQHVKGVQSQGVMATMRHYIGNEQETGRQFTSSNIDDRTAHEVYVWPFQDAVQAGVVSAMCSYNALNYTHSCANQVSLGKWLREELNFQGFVMSDFGAIPQGFEAASANAGTDTVIGNSMNPFNGSMSRQAPFGPNSPLSEAISNGSLTLNRLDDMVIRIVSAWYKVDQQSDFPAVKTDKNVLDPDTNKLIREVSAKSIVMLKNVNRTLPLSDNGTLYVFGQSATVDLDSYPDPPSGSTMFGPDLGMGTFPGGSGSSFANLPYLITPYEALQSRGRSHGWQVASYFNNFNHTLQTAFALAANAAAAPCVVDVRQNCGEGYDRANLSASWEGDSTILAVASTCQNTIVAYSSCGPFNVSSWYDHPNVTAILNAGGLGQEAGNALVDVLYGDTNPSARLPYTIGRYKTDYPATVDFATQSQPMSDALIAANYTEGLFVDYRWFDKKNITPIYEFGFGLSYTSFSYSDLSVQPSTASLKATVAANDTSLYDCLALVTAQVHNIGSSSGTEIPQLYLGSPAEGAPIKVLRGFEAVYLSVGSSTQVSFQLTRRDLSFWDAVGWTLPAGSYDVYVGASSRDLRLNDQMEFDLV